VPLLLPVAHQISNAVFYIEQPDVILANPMQLILPFLAVILYALTVERVLPSRWIFVAACLIFALTPPVMALLHVGEFSYTVDVFDATLYTHVPHVIVDWSAVLNLSLYYLGLAVLGIQMKEAPAEESAAEEKTTPGEPEPAPAEPETPEV